MTQIGTKMNGLEHSKFYLIRFDLDLLLHLHLHLHYIPILSIFFLCLKLIDSTFFFVFFFYSKKDISELMHDAGLDDDDNDDDNNNSEYNNDEHRLLPLDVGEDDNVNDKQLL